MRSEILQLARATTEVSGQGRRTVAFSGTIAAASALDILWAWRLPDYLPAGQQSFLERVYVRYTTIAAFGTPVTAGRALALTLLTGMPTAGSKSTAWLIDKNGSGGNASSSIQIADTAALTGGTVGFSHRLGVLPLAGFGLAGATVEREWKWGLDAQNEMIAGGSFIGLIAQSTFDAGGTFELEVEADVQGLPANYPIP